MKNYSTLEIKIDNELKEKAENIFNKVGITHEELINNVYKKIVDEETLNELSEVYNSSISESEVNNMAYEEAMDYIISKPIEDQLFELLDISNMSIDELEESLIEAMEDVKKGNYYTSEEIRKELGLL